MLRKQTYTINIAAAGTSGTASVAGKRGYLRKVKIGVNNLATQTLATVTLKDQDSVIVQSWGTLGLDNTSVIKYPTNYPGTTEIQEFPIIVDQGETYTWTATLSGADANAAVISIEMDWEEDVTGPPM